MNLARSGHGLVASLFMVCAVIGCGSGPVGDTHRPTPTIPFDSQRVLLELNQTWIVTGPGKGAFGNVHNLESTPSLFETSWHLKVASEIGTPLPNISKPEAQAWIAYAIGRPPTDGFKKLQELNLVVAALRGLGLGVPAPALAAIAQLREGQLYALDAGRQPSWSATALAVLTLRDASAPIPSDLAAEVRSALPGATAARDATGWAEELIPVWTIADLLLPANERAAQHSRLVTSLHAMREWATAQPLGEQAMFIVAQANDIARANSVDELTPLSALAPLASPSGYLVTGAGDPTPSMTNTYYALSMGYAPPGSHARELLAEYLQWSVGPRGWRQDVGEPEPTTSFYSWEVSRALGQTGPEAALRSQVAEWVAANAKATSWKGIGNQDQAYFLFLLAKSIDVPVPVQVADLVRAELAGDGAQLAPPDLLNLARESLALNIEAGTAIKDAWRSMEAQQDLTNIRGAQAALTMQTALRETIPLTSLKSRLAALHPELLWNSGPGISTSDLFSSATGGLVTGRSDALGAAVNSTFADNHGYWLLPTTVPQNNVVEPMTLYFGLWLTGAKVDDGGVF
jgi:hypothetical protein